MSLTNTLMELTAALRETPPTPFEVDREKDILNQIVTSSEVAAILGIERDTVSRMFKSGLLYGRQLGREWVTTHQAIQTYQQTKRNRGNPEFGVKYRGRPAKATTP